MSGSLGGGRSRSSQRSESEMYGISQSEQQALSGSQSTTGSLSQSRQNIAFQDVFSSLYGNASGAAANAAGGAGMVSQAAQQLFTGGSQFLQSLGGDTGSAYLDDRLNADNPVLNDQIAQLQEDTGRLFREEFNPAITSRAVSGGTLGGGRQGVAQGLAIESAARTFNQGATALRSGDIARRDAVAQSIAQNSLQAASTGLGALPSLLNVLQQGNSAELGVYGQLSQILGGPTVLSSSDASSSGQSTSFAESLARSFGQQSSRSYGSGSGSSWNFDTSFGLIGS
jgi:hypothetical protein